MSVEFSILGRGRAGTALASAWGIAALPHTAAPHGTVLLAVPDHAIESIAARFPGRALHLSGSLHLADVPCAHPLTSFDGTARDFSGTPLGCSGAVPKAVTSAFEAIGFVPFELPADKKALYHAAAVLCSGHAATLWLGAQALLAAAGIELPGRGVFPLLERTVENIERLGAAGRTGPFVRGDAETIARDTAALPPEWREIFLALGRAVPR